jgi:hypothetical protein
MRTHTGSAGIWLAGAVLVHLAVSVVHGTAHNGANVAMSAASTAFVFAVILIGPLVGLAAWPIAPRTGAWIVAVTMFGSLVFGLVNHFLIAGPDHVSHVAAPWRAMFGTTAALLVVTEALGSGVGIWCAAQARRAALDRN